MGAHVQGQPSSPGMEMPQPDCSCAGSDPHLRVPNPSPHPQPISTAQPSSTSPTHLHGPAHLHASRALVPSPREQWVAPWHPQGIRARKAPRGGPEQAGRCHRPAMPRPLATRSLALAALPGQPPAAVPQEGGAAPSLPVSSRFFPFRRGLWRGRLGIRSSLLRSRQGTGTVPMSPAGHRCCPHVPGHQNGPHVPGHGRCPRRPCLPCGHWHLTRAGSSGGWQTPGTGRVRCLRGDASVTATRRKRRVLGNLWPPRGHEPGDRPKGAVTPQRWPCCCLAVTTQTGQTRGS